VNPRISFYRLVFLALLGVGVWGVEGEASALEASLVGSLRNSAFSYDTAGVSNDSGKANLGVGGLVGVGVFPFFTFETGALFTKNTASYSYGAQTFDVEASYLQIPAYLRCDLLPIVNFKAGAYYGVAASTSALVAGVSAASQGLKDDVGLLFGAGVSLPIAPLLSFRVDILSHYGLKNLNLADTPAQYNRALDVWAGIQFKLL
jgi:hypothetical protein